MKFDTVASSSPLLATEMDPATRYTFRRITASIMKIAELCFFFSGGKRFGVRDELLGFSGNVVFNLVHSKH